MVNMNNQKLLNNSFPILSITFGIGIFCFIIGLTVGWFARQKTKDLLQTEGNIIALKSFGSWRRNCKAPVVEYEVEGTVYRINPDSAYSCDLFPSIINNKTVYYPANNPNQGKLANFNYRWFVPSIFILIGTMFCLISGFIFANELKLERKKLPNNKN